MYRPIPNYRCATALSLFIMASLAVACGSSGPQELPDAASNATALNCPAPGLLPFVLANSQWQNSFNEEAVADQPRIKHISDDIMGNSAVGFAYTTAPGNTTLDQGTVHIRGTLGRIENDRGLFAEEISGEYVSLWRYNVNATTWDRLDEGLTGTFADGMPGTFDFDLGTGIEDVQRDELTYIVLNAEPSCLPVYSYNLPAGTPVVITDIDNTMTGSDLDVEMQVADGEYDPQEKLASVELTHTWTNKGYQMIYLTARPHILRAETRAWLDQHGYAQGPLITATNFVFGDSARQYKGEWVQRAATDLQWNVVAVYGNSQSDIDAYEDGGISKATTFTIGELAGASGTVAIPNNDYTAHIQDYVMEQPDADDL